MQIQPAHRGQRPRRRIIWLRQEGLWRMKNDNEPPEVSHLRGFLLFGCVKDVNQGRGRRRRIFYYVKEVRGGQNPMCATEAEVSHLQGFVSFVWVKKTCVGSKIDSGSPEVSHFQALYRLVELRRLIEGKDRYVGLFGHAKVCRGTNPTESSPERQRVEVRRLTAAAVQDVGFFITLRKSVEGVARQCALEKCPTCEVQLRRLIEGETRDVRSFGYVN